MTCLTSLSSESVAQVGRLIVEDWKIALLKPKKQLVTLKPGRGVICELGVHEWLLHGWCLHLLDLDFLTTSGRSKLPCQRQTFWSNDCFLFFIWLRNSFINTLREYTCADFQAGETNCSTKTKMESAIAWILAGCRILMRSRNVWGESDRQVMEIS